MYKSQVRVVFHRRKLVMAVQRRFRKESGPIPPTDLLGRPFMLVLLVQALSQSGGSSRAGVLFFFYSMDPFESFVKPRTPSKKNTFKCINRDRFIEVTNILGVQRL